MQLTIDDYFTEFQQDVFAKAGADANFHRSTFTDTMCEFLERQDILTEGFCNISYKKESKGIAADAWSYSHDFELLTLLISDYRTEQSLASLTNTVLKKHFKRLGKFLEFCVESRAYLELEESSDAYEIAKSIATPEDFPISKVQFVLLSNASLSSRAKGIPNDKVAGIECSFEIWDISRLHRIELSTHAKEMIEIKLADFCDKPIPCLPASTGSGNCTSYLLVLPGQLVASLYKEYGERLLEQNVRTFLQFRGKINKGLRNTILNEPDMFFAYNNGLTATADDVVLGKANEVVSIRNLQIVNGGQTTASLFTADKASDCNVLADVYVQMKLSVISSEDIDTVVSNISQYANTQNKVNAADFFSNHPFHLRLEEFSRRIWAPSPDGDIRETHWFYERARGQYINAHSTMSKAATKKFLLQNPKAQMLVKTDAAKYENCFAQLPHLVSKGAQANFATFADQIGKTWDKDPDRYNERFFKNMITKAICFRFLDRLILKQSWYGGYKAQIVYYTLAKLSSELEKRKRRLDFDKIWKRQSLSEELGKVLLSLAQVINEKIQDTPQASTNVTQWCKQPMCWESVKAMDVDIDEDISLDIVRRSETREMEIEAKRDQKIANSVNAQTSVFKKGASYWQGLAEWESANKSFTPKERAIVQIATQIPTKFPTEKQAIILLKAEERALQDGFFPNKGE